MSLCDFVIVKYSEFNDIFNGEHIGKTYKSWTDIISNRHNRFLLKSSLKNEMLLEFRKELENNYQNQISKLKDTKKSTIKKKKSSWSFW